MLQTYPEILLDYAVDGVIQGSARHHSMHTARLAAFVRKQVRAERERAQQEAAALRASAASEGYREGMLIALGALLPLIERLTDTQADLQAAVCDRLHARLNAMCVAPDVAVPQIQAALGCWLQAGMDIDDAVLYVPSDCDALTEAVQGAPGLEGLVIRPSQRTHPVLQVGQISWELDIPHALQEDMERALAEQLPRLQATIGALATDYAARIQHELATAACVRGFSALKEIS